MMLLVDVEPRFSAVQVLEHPWVNVSGFLFSCVGSQCAFVRLWISSRCHLLGRTLCWCLLPLAPVNML